MSGFVECRAAASFVQRAMWATEQRHRGTALNVMVLPWHIHGPLSVAALRTALEQLSSRHPTLRSRLVYSERELWQVTDAAQMVPLTVIDVQEGTDDDRFVEATRLLEEIGREPIRLGEGPAARVVLLALGPVDHILCFFVHHAMCDAWSSQIIGNDLAAMYDAAIQGAAATLPAIPEQYAAFAAEQASRYESGGYSSELAYWRTELEGAGVHIDLPTRQPRRGVRDWTASTLRSKGSVDLLGQAKALARERRSTLFAVLLATLAVSIHRQTAATDMLLGVSTVNRWSAKSTQFVGCATNLLPARIRISREQTFEQLVDSVNQSIRKLLAYGRIPFELIAREMSGPVAGRVLPQIWCQYRESPAPIRAGHQELTMTPLRIDRAAILCDLEVDLIESAEGLECDFAYREPLFDAGYIAGMMNEFWQLLRLGLASPRQCAMSMTPNAESGAIGDPERA